MKPENHRKNFNIVGMKKPEEIEYKTAASLFNGGTAIVKRELDELDTPNKYFNKDDGHILVVGSTSCGKSSCFVIPSLRKWTERVFCIDIKGELYKNTREKRPNIKVFDPLNTTAATKKYGFNLYAVLDETKNIAQEAEAISMALVQMPPDTRDAFWIQSARNMLTGCILHFHNEGKSFIETIKEILYAPIDDNDDVMPIAKLMKDIYETSKSKDAKYYVSPFVGLHDKTLSGVYAELSRNIMIFATDEDIKKCLTKTETISPDDLENGKDVYICVPEYLLRQWKGLLTLMVSRFLRHFEKRPDLNDKPILFMLDEFPRLGKIEGVTECFATLRSKKITMCAVVQSLSQLDFTYGEITRRVIVDNCRFTAIFNVNDVISRKYFSDMIGGKYTWNKGVSFGIQASGVSATETREPFIYPERFSLLEVMVAITPNGVYCHSKVPFFEIDAPSKKNFNHKYLQKPADSDSVDTTSEQTAEEPSQSSAVDNAVISTPLPTLAEREAIERFKAEIVEAVAEDIIERLRTQGMKIVVDEAESLTEADKADAVIIELTDEEWAQAEPLIPQHKGKGRKPKDNRLMLNAILWRIRIGPKWEDMPEYYGSWKTVYDRFRLWYENGLLLNIFAALGTDADYGLATEVYYTSRSVQYDE